MQGTTVEKGTTASLGTKTFTVDRIEDAPKGRLAAPE